MKRLKAQEKLPMELEEEILSRLPPLSLARFRTACKQWNTLIVDKRFIDNHLARARAHPQFILTTKSKLCSVSVNLSDAIKIEVCDLTLDHIHGLESEMTPRKIHHCDGLLLCCWNNGATATVWNPWLRQSRWIELDTTETLTCFAGIGYDNRKPENCDYEIFASQYSYKYVWKFFNFASNAWKEQNSNTCYSSIRGFTKGANLRASSSVSLNGNLYWVASCIAFKNLFIICMDFSQKRFELFCNLPCKKICRFDTQVLAVFRGDRFSVLDQCNETKKIEIWVTKNKITRDGKDVEWMKFMEMSCPNLPDLVQSRPYSRPSYFIEDKTLIVCSCDKAGQAWIYVVRENKLSTIRIDYVVDPWPSHCTCFPSLVPVPRGQGEEVELRV
ncbi:unnamed protein product [Arabidopsis lyrata]|uniref:F-box domain-containing protein n=1 Tax=Arabidopsis lyrata subsp. lyrata TaxID=81972 RepID=D7L646_ARALL|nr:putative F-box protein At1g47390 [Arabidopsis lyrata subsp. lyrata]EFH61411.1 hypothetical protein ARALYDRAFT_897977 [Arabidopsis lyrata subsp. lyrata]CAH8260731.1 unnamed protein product [Arabidopsis lyrata]|eukprot:XP_002885152.1 putative F-box protein At1g47390 [Arabidopsis lyrata subsp. lyrata]